MNSKSVRSAVIIQPPLDQWPQIQEFREIHDKAFIRWMPHINLLYPFFQANEDIVSKITKAVAKISPFKKFSFFEHSAKSCTLYLDPHPIDDLVKLQQTLEAIFPDCNDLSTRGNGKFSPHLTLGQFNGPVPTKQKMLELSKSWKDCSFVVDSIHIIARNDSDPFSIVHTIPLGPTKEENKNTPTKKKQPKVDKAAEEAASFAEMKSFVQHANGKAIVMLDVQQIKREGAPPNLRNLLFNRDNFPGVNIIAISPTKSDTIVRCNTCERMVGKWKFETNTDSLAVCGDFETLTTQFRDANITYNPIFTLPHSISQFSSHFNLPSNSSHDEFTISLSSNVTPPSVDDEVREISQRVKRWMKKMNGNLPTSKSRFHNATRSLRIFKGFVDSGAVLQRILSENKIKFCTPCKNYSIMPEAYQSKSAKLQENDEVGKIAAKTVDWLCKQRRVPPNVKSLRAQIDTFGFTKEVDAEKVWQVLLEEGVVSSDNPVTYNLVSIRVDERPPRNPLFPDIELPTPQKQQQQQQQQHKTQNYGDEDYEDDENSNKGYEEDENERDDDEYDDDEYNDNNGRRQDRNENFENLHFAFEKRAQAAISNFDKIIATASTSSKPRPFESFDDMHFREDLLRGIYQFGLEKPSLIQKQSLPAMLNGKDTVVQSQAGTGKTIAYVIAVLHRIKKENTTQSIVLVPTRELAVYVSKVVNEIGDTSYMKVQAHVIVGGASVYAEALQKGPQVVVGTCGRIADMINRDILQTKNVQMIVLDEADELLSKEKDAIYFIYKTLPAEAQTVLVSSTFTIETHDLWVKFLREPVLFLEKRDKMITGNFQNIKLVVKREEEKELMLQRVLSDQLSQEHCERVIVFCNTKRKVDWLCSRSSIPGMKGIHGDMAQNERDMVYNEFVTGACSILVTTGQYSRGINNTSVGGIVMYDFPQTAVDYYHRMTRGGRFGRVGICISLITPHDELSAKSVEKYFSFKFKVQK